MAPNSTVVTEEIECVTPRGIKTVDGAEHAVDVIVCATGFDVSQRPASPVIGRNNLDLRDFWEKETINYLSVAAPGFPNYFGKHSFEATMGEILHTFESPVGQVVLSQMAR